MTRLLRARRRRVVLRVFDFCLGHGFDTQNKEEISFFLPSPVLVPNVTRENHVILLQDTKDFVGTQMSSFRTQENLVFSVLFVFRYTLQARLLKIPYMYGDVPYIDVMLTLV